MTLPEFLAVPQAFATSMRQRLGADGDAWLRELPLVIETCAAQWSVRVDTPFEKLSINYVAPCTVPDGLPLVLKVCAPGAEFATEAEALRLFEGRGAVRLLAVDPERRALLLERLLPGTPLSTVKEIGAAISAAAEVMRRLRRPVPENHGLRSYADWMSGMARRAPSLVPDSGFPVEWLEHSRALFAELDASEPEQAVLHGDLHQENILRGSARGESTPPASSLSHPDSDPPPPGSSLQRPASGSLRLAPLRGRRGVQDPTRWYAIDPFGIVDEPACEVGPLLLNALTPEVDTGTARALLARWVDQLSDELALDRNRLRDWGIVRAVLSAFWTLEDGGRDWDGAISCAELLAHSIG